MKTKATMKTLLTMLLMTLCFTTAEAKTQGKGKVYDIVDVMPSFPGGMQEMMNFLLTNVQYPKEAEKKGIEGRCTVRFIVEKNGSISNVKVVRSVHPLLDAEAVRVVNSMPKWTPGKRDRKPVRVKFNIPVQFKLK